MSEEFVAQLPKGVSPNNPGVRIRRAMPKPFARPSVDLGGVAPVRRDWQQIPVIDLKIGDTVPGIGVITRVMKFFDIDADTKWTVVVEGGEDNTRTYPGNDIVYAFAADEQ